MHVSLRSQIDPVHLEKMLHVDTSQQGKHSDKDRTTAHSVTVNTKEKKPMTILYGSNSGTCEGVAQSLAGVAGVRGS
jgi:cytochrome P450 / NADPH-cytochrome P450 reductase